MSYFLAGFVTASAVAVAIKRRFANAQTYAIEASAERGECEAEATLAMGWGRSGALAARGPATHHAAPAFFLWAKASGEAQRGWELCELEPLALSWGRFESPAAPCPRGPAEALASLRLSWHRAPRALGHVAPTTSPTLSLALAPPLGKWDMSLSAYCQGLTAASSAPQTPERAGSTVGVGEFYRRIDLDELPEAFDCDWDAPPSDDAVSSPVTRSPAVTPTRNLRQTAPTTPEGRLTLRITPSSRAVAGKGLPPTPPQLPTAPVSMEGGSNRAKRIPVLRTLPTIPPSPFKSSAAAARGESEGVVCQALSWGAVSAACHRDLATHCCPPLPFIWSKVSASVERGTSTLEATMELQWGRWEGCGRGERAGEVATLALPHTWHRTRGAHSAPRGASTATASLHAASVPKVFEPVTPERSSMAQVEDDELPEALDWEEGGDDWADADAAFTPLSPLATRRTNRVRTPTRMVPSPAIDAIPKEGRLTPIRIGATNRVVISPNGDGVPRTVPPPLPAACTDPVAAASTNRTRSPAAPTHLPTSLPAPLFPQPSVLSPIRHEIRSPGRKTNRIPTPTRTMA